MTDALTAAEDRIRVLEEALAEAHAGSEYLATIRNLNALVNTERARADAAAATAAELRATIANMERDAARPGGWARPRAWHAEVGGIALPVPRLEIHWTQHEDETVARYVLVYRHHEGDVLAVSFSMTSVHDARPEIVVREANGDVRLPMRDGVRIVADAQQLGLRAFATAGDVADELFMGDRRIERRRVTGGRGAPAPTPAMRVDKARDMLIELNDRLRDADIRDAGKHPDPAGAEITAHEDHRRRAADIVAIVGRP